MKVQGFALWCGVMVLTFAFRKDASATGLDRDNNGLNDVWELLYDAATLAPTADTDGDGFTNAAESAAGTDPRDNHSHPRIRIDQSQISWSSVPGKRYVIDATSNFSQWTNHGDAELFSDAPFAFFRLSIDDVDSDGDGVNDYEERSLGFDPGKGNSDRFPQPDLQRFTNALAAASVVNISAIDPLMSERWPDPGVVAVRRRGGFAPITVNLSFGGTAVAGQDYAATTNVTISAGIREIWIEFHPLADSEVETSETIIVTLLPGSGYTVGTNTVADLTVEDDNGLPSAKEAARFLIQAAFGPDQDTAEDADYLPENVESIMESGFEPWLEEQFTRPIGRLQPFVDWLTPRANEIELYADSKSVSWWNRAMGVPKLRPDDLDTVQPDPLRQRVALALSEILVISDRLEDLGVEPGGMAHYYDTLLKHSFGNFEDLLHDVALHPCMGMYLSHLGNRKADPVNRVYPDENFAREAMQLFSIGLWELNQDGTRKLAPDGQPIPTYDNDDITELARVFTGLAFGGSNVNFGLHPRDFTQPMKMWDAHHDCDAKTLLGGLQLPARTPSAGNLGTAGLADVRAAVSNLFHHPNVGPFLGRQLIQRFVTSNPSTGYVGRVAAAFNNNGAGARGDLRSVIKVILLDPEARDATLLRSPTFGKLREPFLRFVNFARAFNASSPSGFYPLDDFTLDHMQEPMKAASVFNFFLPAHSPPGEVTEEGLVAPEFQIINASSAVAAPNHYWNAILGDLHRWGSGRGEYSVRLNLSQELRMVVPDAVVNQDVPNVAPFDPDPLLRRLDLALTGGQLSPPQFQLIRETLDRLPRTSWQWHREYLRVAIYLVVTSPEFCVQK
jgi:uncharacterized protein (DUF1800 family)